MDSTAIRAPNVREHARILLTSIGVSRVIVVDDEYREGGVEELIGLCSGLASDQAAELPYLTGIDFRTDQEVRADLLREQWARLDPGARETVLARARALEAEPLQPPDGDHGLEASIGRVDTKASKSLERILDQLEECEYVTLSLSQWRARGNELLGDDIAENTVFLFDRDFTKEDGTENEGINLIRQVQNANVGYCGLLSHTVTIEGEHAAWRELTQHHDLNRDTFVVIAKERLTDESEDYSQFLRMLRFVGLSARYAKVMSATWSVLDQSVAAAMAAVEWLSVPDFDMIVFGSSRREGVWEPDTLFRVFGILMRREAQRRLRQNANLSADVSEARRISTLSEKLANALGTEETSHEALRIQRFESYESTKDLNSCHIPLDIGDIFQATRSGHQYILLAQPCDLMVRPNGKRSYDRKCGRTGALVQIVVDVEKRKDSWGHLPFYDVGKGKRAFVDFARIHQALLAVLDLCVLQGNGVAMIEVDASCPDLLIQAWKKRYNRLGKVFRTALERYNELERKNVRRDLKLLALPRLSATLGIQADVQDDTVKYGLIRVGRLRQPCSGALLTALTQYHARAEFEHAFDKVRSATAGDK